MRHTFFTTLLGIGIPAFGFPPFTAAAPGETRWIPAFAADFEWLWWTLAGCGTLTLGAIVWNLLLRRQVERRTIELRDELRRRTLAEQSRQQAEEQFRHVIEFCPIGVLMYRLESGNRLILTAGNTAAEKILGIELRSQLGKRLEEIFPGLAHTDIPERYRKICKTGLPWETHAFGYKDQHIQGVYEVYAFQTSAGQMTAMFTDISEQMQSREALAESQRTLSTLIGNLPGIAYRGKNAPDWPMEFISKGCLELTGYTDEQFLNNTVAWNDLIFAADEQYVWDEVQKALAQRKKFQLEYRIRTADGQEKWVWEQGCGIFDASGNVVALEGFITDITARKQIKQKLADSEQRIREMFARMSSAVAVYRAVDDGADFIFTDFNPAAERTEKIKKEALVGRKVSEVFPGVLEFGILDIFRQVWRTGQPMHYPLKRYKDNRVVGWRDNYVYRLPTMEVVALYDDVTERILAEEAREKLMKELQAKNEELEGIVFVASHDLRSPLINIQGFAGELQKSCRELTVLLGREALSETNSRAIRRILDEDLPESLNFISAGTGKMDTLVKGLLRLARIGITQLHIEPVDMNRLMATILKTVQYQTREYDIEIRADNLPPCLGDWVQLNQVFSNLIDNSIKYRHPGRKSVIEISAISRDNRVRYAIRDNGIGVAPEHTKKIFEIFHRLNPAGPVKGEGLGLTIVQRILDRLDGKIDVESSPDNGATFIVELPAVPEK